MMFARGYGYGNNFMQGGWGFLMMGGMLIVTAIVIAAIAYIIIGKQERKSTLASEALLAAYRVQIAGPRLFKERSELSATLHKITIRSNKKVLLVTLI